MPRRARRMPCPTPHGMRTTGTATSSTPCRLRAHWFRRQAEPGRLRARMAPGDALLLSRCAQLLDGGECTHAADAAEIQRFWELAAAENDRDAQLAMGLWWARMRLDGTPHRARFRRGQFPQGGALAGAGRRAGHGRSLVRAVAHLHQAGVLAAQCRHGAKLPGARGRHGLPRRPARMRQQCLARAPRKREQRRARGVLAAAGGAAGLRRGARRAGADRPARATGAAAGDGRRWRAAIRCWRRGWNWPGCLG